MKIPYGARPGGGFVFLGVIVCAALAFLVFGLETPRLDRIWTLSNELRLGRKKPLDQEDFRLLQDALCDHPRLAEDFLEGRRLAVISSNRGGVVETGEAYLIREAKSPELGLAVAALGGGKKDKTLEVRARTIDADREGRAASGAPFEWIAPQWKKCATLIEVKVKKGLFTVGKAGEAGP